MKTLSIASLLSALTLFFQNPTVPTQICFYTTTGSVGFRADTCPATAPVVIGIPLTAKDGNGTAIFQAGQAVVCPSAVPGPGAGGPQVTCPAALYLPLQLVSINGNIITVADNGSISGAGSVAPFTVATAMRPPAIAPGYTVRGTQWTRVP